MNADETLGLIIEDYCKTHGISISEFSRKSNVSRAYINRIIGNKLGKFGVSTTIKELIADGLDMTYTELSDLIKKYQNNEHHKILATENNSEEDELIVEINNQLKKLNNDQLKKIHDIVANSDGEKLELLMNSLENMK